MVFGVHATDPGNFFHGYPDGVAIRSDCANEGRRIVL